MNYFLLFLIILFNINKCEGITAEYHRLGQKAYKKKEYTTARKCFKKALKPAAALFYNIGATYLREEDLRKAEKHYKLSIEINPDLIEAYNNLAITYIKLGELDEAERVFLYTIKKAPYRHLLYYNLAYLYLLKDKLEEAEKMYKEAINLKKDFSQAYNNLGIVYYTQGKLKEAKESFRKAVRINRKEPRYYYNLAICLISLEEKDERIIWALRNYIILEKKDIERLKYVLSLLSKYL